jgi:hypothetical protein
MPTIPRSPDEGGWCKLNNLISLEFHYFVTGKWCCEVVLYGSDSMCGLLTLVPVSVTRVCLIATNNNS